MYSLEKDRGSKNRLILLLFRFHQIGGTVTALAREKTEEEK